MPAIVMVLIVFSGCRNNNFKIKGEIYGAEQRSVILEKSDFYGRWLSIDSTKIGKNGNFSFSFPSPAAPDIYRIELEGKYIYIPIDSTETITLTSSLKDFGRDFTLAGSINSETLTNFEKDFQGLPSILTDEDLNTFKKDIFTKYMLNSPGSIVNYYILTKMIGDKPLYDPQNSTDVKYFGAVANGFKSIRPNDPHTALLEQTTLNAYRKRNKDSGKYMTFEAEEITMIDLVLQNEKGEIVKLSENVGKGKPVVVIFSYLNQPESPSFNYALDKVYKRHNVEFYNVSLDPDQYSWRDAAINLPWITVYDPDGLNSEAIRKYNVNQLPVFYIYNSKGELEARVSSIDELEKKL